MLRQRHQFDTHIEIVTPENIAFKYRVAGPFRRLPAYLIDLLIRAAIQAVAAVIFAISAWILGIGGMWLLGANLVLLFLLMWFYGGWFEAYYNGQTPGKRLMQIRVVSVDGQPITGMQAVLRNVLRAIDWVGFYQVGLWAAMFNDRFQRLGDLASGTMVIIEQRPWQPGVVWTGTPEVIRLAGLVPASFQPDRSFSRTVALYVQRRRMFSWARRMEMSRHLGEPLRQKFDLPTRTDLDLLLCAIYHRTFITDRPQEPSSTEPSSTGSPFQASPLPVAQLDEGGDE